MNMFEFFALALVLISVLYVVTTICETVKYIKKEEYGYLNQTYKTTCEQMYKSMCKKEDADNEKV